MTRASEWKARMNGALSAQRQTTQEEEPMGKVETIVKAAAGQDRSQVMGKIRSLALEEFIDLPEAAAIEKTLDRWPELKDAYYRAPLPGKAAVGKAEDLPGHDIAAEVKRLESDTGTLGAQDRAIRIALLKARYYSTTGQPVAAAQAEQLAEQLAKYR